MSRCLLHAASGSGSGIGATAAAAVAALGGLRGDALHVVPRPSVGMHGFRGDALPLTVVKQGMRPLSKSICICSVCRLSLGLLPDRLLLADGGGPAAFGTAATFVHVFRYLLPFSSAPSLLSRSSSSSEGLTSVAALELLTTSPSFV